MAYPATLPVFVDIDENSRPMATIALCTYVNAITQQQSGGTTFAISVPDQSTSGAGKAPGAGLSYINASIAAMNATITRASLGTTPGVLWSGLDYSAYQPALNAAITLATAVKVALGG